MTMKDNLAERWDGMEWGRKPTSSVPFAFVNVGGWLALCFQQNWLYEICHSTCNVYAVCPSPFNGLVRHSVNGNILRLNILFAAVHTAIICALNIQRAQYSTAIIEFHKWQMGGDGSMMENAAWIKSWMSGPIPTLLLTSMGPRRIRVALDVDRVNKCAADVLRLQTERCTTIC